MNSCQSLENKWYVLYTYPNCEKKIFTELSKRAFEVFFPTRKVLRQWKDRKKELVLPIFPNYIFVKVSSKEMWPLLNLFGVVKYVSLEGRPVAVTDAEIEKVKKITLNGHSVQNEETCAFGERVRVNRGPFQGFEGVYLFDKNNSKLYIQLEVIKQSVSVEIPAHFVDRISS
jgi:transcription antitermination factor NusG